MFGAFDIYLNLNRVLYFFLLSFKIVNFKPSFSTKRLIGYILHIRDTEYTIFDVRRSAIFEKLINKECKSLLVNK